MNTSIKIGLFGGTFNPIHNAHLKVAKTALEQFEMEKIIFIPSKIPPHKKDEDIPKPELRYEMVELAIKENPAFEISSIELNREGPSYTVDTIAEMKEEYDDVAFIVGADNLIQIKTWKEPEKLLSSCPFLIAPRRGYNRDNFQGEFFSEKELFFLDMEEIEISSTEIRNMYQEGVSIDNYVPDIVKSYIKERGIYRATTTRT